MVKHFLLQFFEGIKCMSVFCSFIFVYSFLRLFGGHTLTLILCDIISLEIRQANRWY